jgi:phosphoribosyl 1,2-cyclic phosphodiesterase
MKIKTIASGSTGNAYLISDGKTSILLECGVPIKKLKEALDFKLAQTVLACFISHEHGDHIKAVHDLISMGISCYASAGTWKAIEITPKHIAQEMPMYNPDGSRHIVNIGAWRVMAFDVKHDAAEAYGYLIDNVVTGERLLYFTDTPYIKYTFSGITHIIAEANYCEDALREKVDSGETPSELVPRLIKNHMGLKQLIETLKANDLSKLRAIYLAHLSNRHSDAEKMKLAVQAETGAEVYIC